MRPICLLIIAALMLGSTGCMSDRTKNMTDTCQNLLDQSDKSSARRFIRDADRQLEMLNKPQNRITKALRDIQDHDALTYKPALEACLWQLKSRQS